MNRPLNSLREIFLCWHPQTKADLDRRLSVLDNIRERESSVAWRLMYSMLPRSHSTAHPTASPRYREWAPDASPEITIEELQVAASAIASRLLEEVGTDGERWQNLIEVLSDLPSEQQNAIIETLVSVDLESFELEDSGVNTVWWTLSR